MHVNVLPTLEKELSESYYTVILGAHRTERVSTCLSEEKSKHYDIRWSSQIGHATVVGYVSAGI